MSHLAAQTGPDFFSHRGSTDYTIVPDVPINYNVQDRSDSPGFDVARFSSSFFGTDLQVRHILKKLFLIIIRNDFNTCTYNCRIFTMLVNRQEVLVHGQEVLVHLRLDIQI